MEESDVYKSILVEIEDAIAFAEQSPEPGPNDYRQYIFA